MTDLLPLLQEFYRDKLSSVLQHQAAAKWVSQYDANNTYQYIINREDAHLSWVGRAIVELGGEVPAETAEPEEVLGVLREYHLAVGEAVTANAGTVEHFAGDGLMAFFNDPVPSEEHELDAVRMAVQTRDRFAELSAEWRRRGNELGLGIGIATGYATLGRIGFEGRYDYAAIGIVARDR